MNRAAWILVAVVGLTTPVGVVFATRALADTLGRTFGALAASSVHGLKPAGEPAPETPGPLPTTEPDSVSTEALSAKAKGRHGPGRSKARAPAALGVRVSARQVLELARRRAVPQAVPVTAQGPRPAGLRLTGVSGLGVGMRDGDILTRVAGVPVGSVGKVADLVIRARARQAPEISAEFWRDGARGALVVEQPYVTSAPAAAPGVSTSMTSAAPSTNADAP